MGLPSLIELEEAQQLVVEGLAPLGVEPVALRDAYGRRLADEMINVGPPPELDDLGVDEADEMVLTAGTRIGPAELGALAEVDAASVSCYRRPRVTVITSGNELLEPEGSLRPGAVRYSNAYTASALAKLAGAKVRIAGPVPNEPKAARATIEPLLDADVVVFSGGISVGEHDHVKHALTELGAEERFFGLALEPGKSTWFGRRGDTLIFGLPPDPVSATVAFTLLTRRSLIVLSGGQHRMLRMMATLGTDYQKRPGPAEAVRCRFDLRQNGWYAYPTERQSSRLLSSMLGVDCLALLPAHTHLWQAGGWVEVELLDPMWELT
jgi:molybdopterin molybdotransferase